MGKKPAVVIAISTVCIYNIRTTTEVNNADCLFSMFCWKTLTCPAQGMYSSSLPQQDPTAPQKHLSSSRNGTKRPRCWQNLMTQSVQFQTSQDDQVSMPLGLETSLCGCGCGNKVHGKGHRVCGLIFWFRTCSKDYWMCTDAILLFDSLPRWVRIVVVVRVGSTKIGFKVVSQSISLDLFSISLFYFSNKYSSLSLPVCNSIAISTNIHHSTCQLVWIICSSLHLSLFLVSPFRSAFSLSPSAQSPSVIPVPLLQTFSIVIWYNYPLYDSIHCVVWIDTVYVSMCECERELRGPIQRAAQVNVPFITAGGELQEGGQGGRSAWETKNS